MFPYKDENPTLRPAVVTALLIVVTSLVWLFVQGAGSADALAWSVCELGFIPGEVLGYAAPGQVVPVGPRHGCELGTSGIGWLTAITSMFLHGGWFHLIGNMWFLWVFGNNVEDSMGRIRFILFYLVCGLLAAGAQAMIRPSSVVPMVGASGAISGVMGAYLVLFPRVRVHLLVFLGFFVTTVAVPAWLMLFYWAFIQFVGTIPAMAGAGDGGGVAFMAHLGGFIAGAVLIRAFAKRDLVMAHRKGRGRIVFREHPPEYY